MVRRFSCRATGNETCDFFVESERTGELVSMAQDHLEETHDMNMSRDEILEVSTTMGHKESYDKSSGNVNP